MSASLRQEWRAKTSISARFLLVVLILVALIDIPSGISIGPVSLLGIFTILCAFLAWLAWLTRPVVTHSTIVAMWSLGMFMVWALFSAVYHVPTIEGLQNLAVMVAFVGLILVAGRYSRQATWFARSVGKNLTWATWIAMGLFVLRLVGLDQRLGFSSVGDRTFALFALFGVAHYLSLWRYGRRRAVLGALGIFLMIAASLSRVAIVIALSLFILSQLSRTSSARVVRVVLMAGLVLVALYLGVTRIEPLRTRFFEGDRALQLGNLTVNTMGRAEFWRAVFDSYVESPWLGKGAGSAQMLVTARYSKWANHPHNDYLRFLHDYGGIGLGLWLLGLGSLAWTIWRAWMATDRKHPAEAQLHMTAFLSLVAMALAMITDNAVIYAFIMAPLGIIVGTSLGRAVLRRR